ncbi:hypothetical protein KA554_001953 [Salmonella enterica subsp. enterica serovar 13,23:y:e,n,z15]|nr:hypothetical protein [Salmonella enterica subsp. enterica]EJU7761838.1 hypothetical protein [Salmonella enterica subsp. enterica serovar 13,23:y:e,n,z15]
MEERPETSVQTGTVYRGKVTFDCIDDELWFFIEEQTKKGEEPVLIYDELERTVLRWLAEDENVKAAFEEAIIGKQ